MSISSSPRAQSRAPTSSRRRCSSRLPRHLFSREEIETPALVLELLRERGLTLATAESCTGGLVAARLTAIPGSSDVFLGSVVAYANSVKTSQLGVPEELLATFGAVSAETAAAMAEGARTRLGADVAVSVTGVAGPGGGTAEKPVGLVFLHAAGPQGELAASARLPRRPRHDPGPRDGRGAPPRAQTCHRVVTDT